MAGYSSAGKAEKNSWGEAVGVGAMVSGKGKRVVLVTCGSMKEARQIAKGVVEARLAACVNIGTAPVESVYWWKGKIASGREFLLVMKTTAARVSALEKEVRRLHSYEVPEFVVMEVAAGSKEYLRWVEESVGRRG
jgi:periplasmic divalent cation tolerance protein